MGKNNKKRRFIVIRDFNDVYDDDITFGYEVYDLDTKEIKYFSFYTNEDIYTPGILHEFDPMNKKQDYFLNEHFIFGGFNRTNTPLLPDEIVSSVYDSILLHRKYNEDNNYSSENLDSNALFLVINYEGDIHTLLHGGLSRVSTASYNSFNNTIGFYIDKLNWQNISDDVKKKISGCALHEVGHMEATSRVLDTKSNVLYLKTGFSHHAIGLTPILADDGSIIYDTDSIMAVKNFDIGKSLEEIANEYKCSLLTNGKYSCTYPNLGNKLNTIFKDNLLNFRYNASINDVISYLVEIVPNEDLALELLNTIKESVKVVSPSLIEEREKKVQKALSLMNIYEAKIK